MSDPAPPAVVADENRLAAVRATGLLDTATEESFDRLTRLAAKLTGAPVTFISLVDSDRDFYKSCFGFPEPLASRRELTGTTFCHYALVSDGPLVIEDTTADPVYRQVPTVETLGVRAYLGVPLVTSAGMAIGSFCAIDFAPRKWSALDVDVMQELAASTLREIELRASIESALATQSRLRAVLDHVPVGVVFAEAPTGRIVLANAQIQRILGRPVMALQSVSEYAAWKGYHSDGRLVEAHEWPLARALRGETVANAEIQYECDNGRLVWLRVHGAPVLNDAGEITGGIIAVHDIDRERTMQMENTALYREAQEANRAKDEFFAALSHELRTPMTSIIGWTRILRDEVDGDNELAREAMDSITSSAQLQAQLVDDLLDVSRISTGKIVIAKTPLDINEVVEESLRNAQPIATTNGVRLRPRLATVPPVHADRARIRQIVNNLLSNAIKFTSTGGLIEVATQQRSDGWIEVTVTDTGRGIDAALLPHIFERHRQAESAEKGGLGLGLTIVRHLAELHGGTVRAASDGPGKGSTFTIRLPPAGI